MTITNMTLDALVSNNSNLSTIVEALAKGNTYQHTLSGALGIITKYWNKGYGECAKGLGFNTPTELRKYMENAIMWEKCGENGIDSRMFAESEDKEGSNVTYHWGTWAPKKVEDESKTITDKKGKEIHPYLMYGETVVELDMIKSATNVTPTTIFTFIIQNMELVSGRVCPQTDLELAKRRAEIAEKERIANKSKKNTKKSTKPSEKPVVAKRTKAA